MFRHQRCLGAQFPFCVSAASWTSDSYHDTCGAEQSSLINNDISIHRLTTTQSQSGIPNDTGLTSLHKRFKNSPGAKHSETVHGHMEIIYHADWRSPWDNTRTETASQLDFTLVTFLVSLLSMLWSPSSAPSDLPFWSPL